MVWRNRRTSQATSTDSASLFCAISCLGIHTYSIDSLSATIHLLKVSTSVGSFAQGARSPRITWGSYQSKPAVFALSLTRSRMPRQSLVLLLEHLMQSSPILTQVRQRQCLLSPNPARHILRSAIKVNCAVEGRRCKPFEFFGWIRLGLLQGSRKHLCQIIQDVSQRSGVANLSRVFCNSRSLIEKLHRYVDL